jgi:hypothetical protein
VLKTTKQQNFMVVDLKEGVKVHTLIPSDNHAALRCGFAGYPINPRWTPSKFHAWKTGKQLKESLSSGEMVVRSTDSMLVLATEIPHNQQHSAETSETPKLSIGRYQLVIGGFRIG